MFNIMLFLYNILLHFALLITLPYYLVKAKKTGVDIRYWFGMLPAELKQKNKSKKTVWVHAVSVGEVNAVKPLLKKIKEQYPDWFIVLSTITGTGQAVARQSVAEADYFIFFPSDLPWNLRHFFKYINPQLLILVETELWPNLISLCANKSIPIILVNGRISIRSFSRYRQATWFFRPLLNKMTLCLMQSPQEADRIIDIGAPQDRVINTGNIKFDIVIPELTAAEKLEYLTLFGFKPTDTIWLVGSTHPGEEIIILRVYQSLLEQFPDLKLILVPRHPHRAPEVIKEIEKLQVTFSRRSELNNTAISPSTPFRSEDSIDSNEINNPQSAIILVDTVGELTKLYSLATVVFVGGSLVPIGGHNVLEPAALGKPVLFGHYMHNFSYSADLLLSTEGGIQINDEIDLETQLTNLFNDPNKRNMLGGKAKSAVLANQGAAQKTLSLLAPYLKR